ncbi:MCE family protein [Mycobacterium sp. NAZ190054]|uniref:MCE family protein n=1 Tax=Mycobacterium sp. NAZ190054 TaxID=1747766 RepID=UPI0009E8EAEA|nr:MCE family protein [Mycobacterium sp. NAZ190054]
MLKYRAEGLIRQGFIGIVLAVLVVAVGLAPERLMTLATSVPYQAVFTEAGGLAAGNDVKVSGVKVGTISKISLQHGKVVVDFTVKGTVGLRSETTAHIKIGSLLGRRVLVLDPAGTAKLPPRSVIPLSRTSSPYAVTDALNDVTTNVAGTDTDQLNQALDTLSATLDQIAPQLGPTFDGLTRLSKTINGRNESLRELLESATSVTGVLGQRSEQINSLILNANTLLGVLVDRRQAIVNLLQNTSLVAKELSGLVHDNEAELAPTLDRLNAVTAVLEKNRDNIALAIPRLRKVSQTNAEAVSSGGYYNAFVGNLMPGRFIQPFMDWAFGIQPRNLVPMPTCGEDGDCYNREEPPFEGQIPHP